MQQLTKDVLLIVTQNLKSMVCLCTTGVNLDVKPATFAELHTRVLVYIFIHAYIYN